MMYIYGLVVVTWAACVLVPIYEEALGSNHHEALLKAEVTRAAISWVCLE